MSEVKMSTKLWKIEEATPDRGVGDEIALRAWILIVCNFEYFKEI